MGLWFEIGEFCNPYRYAHSSSVWLREVFGIHVTGSSSFGFHTNGWFCCFRGVLNSDQVISTFHSIWIDLSLKIFSSILFCYSSDITQLSRFKVDPNPPSCVSTSALIANTHLIENYVIRFSKRKSETPNFGRQYHFKSSFGRCILWRENHILAEK